MRARRRPSAPAGDSGVRIGSGATNPHPGLCSRDDGLALGEAIGTPEWCFRIPDGRFRGRSRARSPTCA